MDAFTVLFALSIDIFLFCAQLDHTWPIDKVDLVKGLSFEEKVQPKG